jgi:hypothetical protein
LKKNHLIRHRAASLWLCGLTFGLGSALVSAHDIGRIAPGHPTGHVQRPSNITWPPQPQGVSNVIDQSDLTSHAQRLGQRDQRFNAVEQRMASNPQASAMRWGGLTRLSVHEHHDKASGVLLERRYHYFDRQANATVMVTEPKDGEPHISSTPAATYQPEITAAEVSEAVALAKAHFGSQGHQRVKQLNGFGIQAYQPTGQGFYDGRVIYVSFHVNNDSDPEYVAWVDLSSQKILKARKEVAP